MNVIFQKGRMEKTIETVRSNFNSIRTGRASPAMLDKIEVRNIFGVCPSPFIIHSIATFSFLLKELYFSRLTIMEAQSA